MKKTFSNTSNDLFCRPVIKQATEKEIHTVVKNIKMMMKRRKSV